MTEELQRLKEMRKSIIWLRRQPHYKNFSNFVRKKEIEALARVDKRIKELEQ